MLSGRSLPQAAVTRIHGTSGSFDILFSVFFTTKPDGYGLSLSSGRKALRDLGGDLVYQSNEKGGAIFGMKIPRESQEENLQDYVSSAIPK